MSDGNRVRGLTNDILVVNKLHESVTLGFGGAADEGKSESHETP